MKRLKKIISDIKYILTPSESSWPGETEHKHLPTDKMFSNKTEK